jgi:hypothetical protein
MGALQTHLHQQGGLAGGYGATCVVESKRDPLAGYIEIFIIETPTYRFLLPKLFIGTTMFLLLPSLLGPLFLRKYT